MSAVLPGQEWSMSCPTGRLFVRIVSLDGPWAWVETTRRRRFRILAATLESGKRAARLVLNPDGSAPAPKVDPPKPGRIATYRAMKAAELRAEGLTRSAIAERFGVQTSTVDRWLHEARASGRLADPRHVAE